MKKYILHIRAIVMFLVISLFLSMCDTPKIDYVDPFKWGKVSDIYGIRGPVAGVYDTIIPVRYFLASDQYFLLENLKKPSLEILAYPSGYPQKISIVLDTTTTLVLSIEENTRMFNVNQTKLIYQNVPKTCIVTFTEPNGFSIGSSLKTDAFINIISQTFNADYSTKYQSNTSPITQIIKKTYYYKTGGGESQKDETFKEYSADVLDFEGKNEYNANGLLTRVERISKFSQSANTTFTFEYSGFDTNGNYTKKKVFQDGIQIEELRRTIQYY